MACRFPEAEDPAAFWRLLRAGRHAFRTPPRDRWDHDAFFSASQRTMDRYYVPTGAFLQDVRSFPAMEFGVPPRRVEVMDPQQRLSLEAAVNALIDAGYEPGMAGPGMQGPLLRPFARRRTGVCMGLSVTEYRSLLAARAAVGMMATGDFGDASSAAGAAHLSDAVSRIVPSRPFSAPGALGNMSAACVAQELDLGGAAFTVDAACASALVAVDDAIRMLRTGQLDMAFAGGVYINLVPDHLIAFSRIGAISKSGLCRPFDAASDGFVQGEGVGMVLLKRVEDAIRDNDRIYAVIDGSACNNDGRGDGPMSPRYEGQVEVLGAAWADAGLDPARVGYIEAHGTGTAVGDRTELSALRAALTRAGRSPGAAPIPLGSSKANIGHTMSAAGIAGLLRAALSLHHRTVPPLAGWTTPHPDHGLDDGFFSVPTAPAAWDADRPHAVISSFGFGGTNGHVVLSAPGVRAAPVAVSFAQPEAPAAPVRRQALPSPAAHLVCTSADSPALLLQHLRQLCDALPDALPAGASDPELLAAAARHLNAQRRRLLRISVTAGTLIDLVRGWKAAISRLEADPSLRGAISRDVSIGDDATPAPVAFLCPGQGSQRVGLLAAWRDIPAFADTLAEADAAVADLLPRPLTDYLYAPDATEEALTDTAVAQPAMLAIGLAVAAVLRGFAVQPAVVLGHSLGEFTAAVLSGAISARDAIRFVAKRGLAMRALPGDHGAMAAVMASREEILGVLGGLPEDTRAQVVLANYNHPSQSVLSGPTDEIDAVIAQFQAIHIKARRIPVSHAFHAPILAPIRPEVDAAVAALSAAGAFTDPAVPFASCIGPAPRAAAEVAAIFARHATSPVDYVDGLAQCRRQGAQLYVQLCSGTTLTAFAKGSVPDARAILAVSDEKPGTPEGFLPLLRLLGWLNAAGHPVDLSGPGKDPAPRATLPPPPRPAESWWGISQEPGRGPQLAARPEAPAASAALSAAPAAPAAPVPSAPDPASGPPVSAPLSPPADPGLASEEEINARVLRVVAKVSAFPVDALSPKQRLLEDLGFDSLMLTELSNKLIEGFPGFGGIPRSMMAQSPTVSDLVRQVQSPGADALPLSDASRPLQGWRPVLLPAPLCGRLAARPARVLDAPTLDELRALPPQSVVVRLPGALIGDDPAVGAVAGFVKALTREWPDHKVTALQGSLEDAAREAAAVERDAEVVWSQQDGVPARSVVGLAPVALAAPPDRLDGLRVLITGGTGWLGQRIARAVAARGGQVTLLGSRTDPGDALAALGASARYLRADLSDPATLADQVAALSAALSADPAYAGRPPSLLIHAAGVLADGPAGSLGADAVRRAHTLKVDALRCLAAAFPRTPIIALGSYAARFGNALQTEYAAANEAMAFLARQLSSPERLVQTQVWGPWESSDMVARVPLHLRRAMREDGVLFVEEQQGIAAHFSTWALDVAIPGGAISEIVLGLDLPAARRVYVEDIPLDPAMGWLRDHALFGRPTVPMAMVVEWAAQYARLTGLAPAGPDAVQIRDLTLYEGAVVEGPVTARLRVENGRFSLHVTAAPTPGSPTPGSPISQPAPAAPKLAWTARLLPGAPLPTGDDLPQIPAGGDPSPLSLADFYAKHTFHGPLLRGITAIDAVGEGSVTGTVRTGSAGDWGMADPWTLGPLAIDSALQLAAVWARLRRGRGGFPVRLASWQQRDVPPGTPLRARLAFASSRADRFTGDLILETLDGQIVAVGQGVEGELRSDELQIPEEHFRFDLNPAWIDLSQRLEMAEATGVRSPYFKVIEGVARDTVRIQGREVLHFSGYNYVGLSGHPEVTRRVQQAVVDYGTSVSASRVASGERPIHHDLEQRIAAALGVEAALVFTAGHATNVTTIGHLFGPKDLILHDELIHDSIFQGMRLSGATRRPFPHEDSKALARMLEQLRPRFERVLIVVEGVYSMDGDICDLPAYVALKKKHKTFLMVDEAHSFGVIGKNGYGVTEHFGIPGSEVDIWMGTLSKSLSSCGGYIAGSQTLITLLKYTAPGFIFSAGLTPANTMAAIAALDIMAREPQHVKKLQDNCAFFYKECQALGIDNGPARGESAVVPVITGNSYHALLLSDALLSRGINVQPILYPAVADNAARLRFFLSSLHSFEQLAFTARVVHEELSRIRLEFPV